MKIILFLIGFAVGTLVLYVLKMKDMARLDELETEIKKARQDFTNAEEEHEHRLKEAIATLQDDYQKKQDQRILNIKTEYQLKINALEAQLGINKSEINDSETSQTTIDALTQTSPEPTAPIAEIPQPTPATFEPPILAADIRSLTNRPESTLSIPTGKAIDPPILAQRTSL